MNEPQRGAESSSLQGIPEPRGNTAVELHDSDVGAIEREGEDLVILFAPAYVHRSEGIPGWDSGTGWTQEARMVLQDARFDGPVPSLPCTLWDGSAVVGERTFTNIIPTPYCHAGSASVSLTFVDGSVIRIEARGVRLELIGDPAYVEQVE